MDSKFTSKWEERQKHASFYQNLLNSAQQAAIAFFAAASLTISLPIAMMKLSGMEDGQDWHMLLVGLTGWLLLIWMISAHFRPVAARINAAYLDEHQQLFPGSRPYQLESFLLQNPYKRPRHKHANDQPYHGSGEGMESDVPSRSSQA